MIPSFLLPEQVAREDGQGAVVALDGFTGKTVLLTLGINRVVEQESLDVSIQGSPDGEHWRTLAAFPQKFYCGTYSLLLDLAKDADVRQLRARWKMGRWGRGDQKPLFGFYVFVDAAKVSLAGAA